MNTTLKVILWIVVIGAVLYGAYYLYNRYIVKKAVITDLNDLIRNPNTGTSTGNLDVVI